MRQALKLHPESHCDAVTAIEVEVARPSPGRLTLRYLLGGRIADLRLPPVDVSGRADGLWQQSCFEAFLRAPSSRAYLEINLAPSRQWAAYRFSGYRDGMAAADEIAPPEIDVRSDAVQFALQALLDLDASAVLPSDSSWSLGLSAVIEETSGRKSYWALAHPPGGPDFHHSDCFVIRLPAA